MMNDVKLNDIFEEDQIVNNTISPDEIKRSFSDCEYGGSRYDAKW